MAAVQLTHLDFVANLLAERFPQLDVRGASDCWLWRSRSGRHPSGYIRVRGANGRTTLPREAYRLLTGEEPAGHLWHTSERLPMREPEPRTGRRPARAMKTKTPKAKPRKVECRREDIFPRKRSTRCRGR
jgi:hypothetical protein